MIVSILIVTCFYSAVSVGVEGYKAQFTGAIIKGCKSIVVCAVEFASFFYLGVVGIGDIVCVLVGLVFTCGLVEVSPRLNCTHTCNGEAVVYLVAVCCLVVVVVVVVAEIAVFGKQNTTGSAEG